MTTHELARRIRDAILSLPQEMWEDAILKFLNESMLSMPTHKILEMRANILGDKTVDQSHRFIVSAIEVIDGEIALRSINESYIQ